MQKTLNASVNFSHGSIVIKTDISAIRKIQLFFFFKFIQ